MLMPHAMDDSNSQPRVTLYSLHACGRLHCYLLCKQFQMQGFSYPCLSLFTHLVMVGYAGRAKTNKREKKCRRPGSNWRPFACEANVITNYTTSTCSENQIRHCRICSELAVGCVRCLLKCRGGARRVPKKMLQHLPASAYPQQVVTITH